MSERAKKLRVGIIGVGNIGSAHAHAIYEGKLPNMQLCALCDTSAEKREELRRIYADIPVFSSCTELFESKLAEAVIIATPHYFHPPVAIEAFSHGLHVLTEKPAGVDCASVKKMCEAAERSGKVFGVMFNQRASKLYAEARRIVSSGELGELRRMLWVITNWYRTQEYYDSGAWRATWSGEGGGVLLNQAPHNLDLWQWICGMPDKLSAECRTAKYHSIEVEDEATVFAEYKNGATAVFIVSTGEPLGTNSLEITGTRGKLTVEKGKLTLSRLTFNEHQSCEASSENGGVTVTELYDEPYNGHCRILENFADAVLSGTPLLASGYEALNELELSNAAYLSSWLGKKITLPVNDGEFMQELEKRKALSKAHGAPATPHEVSAAYKERWSTRW